MAPFYLEFDFLFLGKVVMFKDERLSKNLFPTLSSPNVLAKCKTTRIKIAGIQGTILAASDS